ncbi:ABC transporter ATP-binding protein [Sporanaerobacter sp. PP17-6a]|uniref:ABC transporter ATP-binding protein n=1 Tax=Sporanaerobacter sp. PP17-6a TaxID=1891289 RepID=UPI0008A09917|nr:ABC transporter ATP-binding protein [Sporanaerobacter sp. PP17-6a]SCL85867.1 Multidrug resistance ABC transporter ATP-binding/permease protein BmrA [Sporanaerobacter sp. PP17-6a]
MKENEAEVRINPNKGIWKSFFRLCLKAKLPIVSIIIYCIISMIGSKLFLLVPSKTGELFAGNVSVQIVTMVIVSSILVSLIGQINTFVGAVVNAKIDRNFRNVLWNKVLSLPMKFFDRVPASSLISRITSDTQNLRSFIMDVVISELLGFYTLYITLRQISQYDKSLVYILIAMMPFIVILSFVFGRLYLKAQFKIREEVSNLTRFLSELITTMPIIKAFNKESYESVRGNNAVDGLYKANKKLLYIQLTESPVSTLLTLGQNVALILTGIHFLKKGTMNAATWYAFYLFATQIFNRIASKKGVWETIKSTQGSLYRVAKVLEEPEEGFLPYKYEALESGDIIFQDVSFSYDNTDILKKVSFVIPENKTTAIVGPSGIGKTTVIKLIERFYPPKNGKITIGGNDIQDFNLKNWRNKIAYVSQDAPMMSGSIKDNIVYGVKRKVSDEEIIQAAVEANAHEFIMKRLDGYDTQVGQFGSKLSGGQRQRIAIARALLLNPDILIFDEPTSNLDAVAVSEIMKGIESFKENRTVIIVAHDERAVLDADHIVVFNEDGSISSGSHTELLLSNNFYRRMMGGEKLA